MPPGAAVAGVVMPAPAALTGLSSEEAASRLRQHGPNTTPEQHVSTVRLLVGKFWAPIPWMLELTIVLEIVLGKTLEAVVVAVLLGFNALISWVQESRAQEALLLLQQAPERDRTRPAGRCLAAPSRAGPRAR